MLHFCVQSKKGSIEKTPITDKSKSDFLSFLVPFVALLVGRELGEKSPFHQQEEPVRKWKSVVVVVVESVWKIQKLVFCLCRLVYIRIQDSVSVYMYVAMCLRYVVCRMPNANEC